LTGMDQSLTSTISTMVSPATSNTISKLPVASSAETLTNVYSIIMDDGMTLYDSVYYFRFNKYTP
jgi:hypothetical protein